MPDRFERDAPVTCSTTGHIGNTGTLYTIGTVASRNPMVMRTNQTCDGDAGSCSVTAGNASESVCTGAPQVNRSVKSL